MHVYAVEIAEMHVNGVQEFEVDAVSEGGNHEELNPEPEPVSNLKLI